MLCEGDSRNCQTDIYRNTFLRNLGYLGPLSMFLTPVIPLNVARMACATYIMWDMFDKLPQCSVKSEYGSKALAHTGDVLIWHFVSSLLVPGVVLKNLKVRIGKLTSKPNGVTKFVPGLLFLATIPFLGKLVDSGTNFAMNNTYRKWLDISPYLKEKGGRRRRLTDFNDEFDNIHTRDSIYDQSNDKNNKEKNSGPDSGNDLEKYGLKDGEKSDESISKKSIKTGSTISLSQSIGDYNSENSNEKILEETIKLDGNLRSREKEPGDISRMV